MRSGNGCKHLEWQAWLLVVLFTYAKFTAGSIPDCFLVKGPFLHPQCRIDIQCRANGCFHEAVTLSEAGRWQEAADAWLEVLEAPGPALPEALRPHAHCALGDALQKLGRDTRAAEEFHTATNLAPGLAAAALRHGTALRRLGDFHGAEAAYRRVLRRPQDGGARQATMRELSQATLGAVARTCLPTADYRSDF